MDAPHEVQALPSAPFFIVFYRARETVWQCSAWFLTVGTAVCYDGQRPPRLGDQAIPPVARTVPATCP